MEDPNGAMSSDHTSDAPSTTAVPPTVKLLTRRKAANAQQPKQPTPLPKPAVKVELNDSSQDENDAPVAVVASTSSAAVGVSARKTSARHAAVKRPIINVDAWSSDEEDFAGFEEIKNGNDDARHRNKKIKEEPLSDNEPVDIKLEVKMEHEAEDDNAAVPTTTTTSSNRRTSKRVGTPPPASKSSLASGAGSSSSSAAVVNSPQSVVASANLAAAAIAAAAALSTPSGGAGGKTTTNITDVRYRKPFTFGWKRELVYRAHNDVHRKQYDKAEVYYITPGGKKLRTRSDILANLTEGLDANDFTFAREPIGMSAEEEIIRSAKLQTPSMKQRPVNFLDLGEADPSLGFGKRVPKPKVPKGASPPPASSSAAALALGMGRNSLGLSKQLSNDMGSKAAKGAKAKGEPCTIQCVLAMGTIPQLQCKKCLCLFHPECVVRRSTAPPSVHNYVCESCLSEINESAGDAITVASSVASISSAGASAAVSANNAAAGNNNAINERPNRRNNSGGTNNAIDPSSVGGDQSTTAAAVGTGNASGANSTGPPTASIGPLNGNASSSAAVANNTSGGGSLIGGITTWMPPNANLTTNRSELDISSTPPQSIAIVAGRKYIMVPKTNLMSVSPSGDVKIGDNSGMPLQYVGSPASSVSAAAPVTSTLSAAKPTPTTPTSSNNSNAIANATNNSNDDVSPPFKKRLIQRNASGKMQQPPNSSPGQQHQSSANSAKRLTQQSSQPPSSGASPSSSAAAPPSTSANNRSVDHLFASNFFDNCSTGYNVLMHTFQYLKVQELLRASCVCRMWNQAAQNSQLWRTVRMKNSQVNDWSGLVSTLKRNGTKHLDLRKMLIPASAGGDDAWLPFSQHIGRHADLEAIDLCRLPASVVERLFASNGALRVLNAVSIKDKRLSLAGVEQLQQLRELRLKALSSIEIDSLAPLRSLQQLRHLSLTSVKELGSKEIAMLGELTGLESLELGDCCDLAAGFAGDVLRPLRQLQRLRLEKGVESCCTFEIIDAVAQMPSLVQLELVNFDIKPEFDGHLAACRNVKRLLIIPTYISQSATTNHMILNALLRLAGSLEQLTWVVTLELLRVTELYVDQCDGKRKERKSPEDKIPVLKPVPGMAEMEGGAGGGGGVPDVPPQVEILPLEKVERLLASNMPDTNCAIIKLPFHATWRQCMTDGQ